MDDHYERMRKLLVSGDGFQNKKRKVGVFFCGNPIIGYELADRCWILTLRGREDKSLLQYHFMMEVF
jgi:dual oxidase